MKLNMTLEDLMTRVDEAIDAHPEKGDELTEEEQATLFMIIRMFPRDFVLRNFLTAYISCHAFLVCKNLEGPFALHLCDAMNRFIEEVKHDN